MFFSSISFSIGRKISLNSRLSRAHGAHLCVQSVQSARYRDDTASNAPRHLHQTEVSRLEVFKVVPKGSDAGNESSSVSHVEDLEKAKDTSGGPEQSTLEAHSGTSRGSCSQASCLSPQNSTQG